MKIATTQYNANNKALEIYLSGCDGFCGDDCHNKELWDFTIGSEWRDEIFNIKSKINSFDSIVDAVWVLGGEPLLHDDLVTLLRALKVMDKEIYLFTRFDFDSVSRDILDEVDFIKCGYYNCSKKSDDYTSRGIKLPTTNQCVYKKGEDYYEDEDI